ncbi:hypothetical protein ACNFH8_03060 [Pseudomonas sp. NY15436]|uniref:hypothetical protein n=1 Tax=Pseudomonas sp. NY15436 TaxID=3400359 RepID=UPI003A8619E6
MGRRINKAWFSQYRAASAELPTALARGERRGEILLRHTQQAGVREATFARMMKAGRALDSLAPDLEETQVHCAYMQADVLGKIAQISSDRAEELLSSVLANTCSLEQLQGVLAELQQEQPDTASLLNRDSARRLVLAHERSCTEAIARVGASFFGVPGGRILRQTGRSQYQAPNFLVVNEEGTQAAIFVRIGGISKPAMSVSLDFLQLALAHRALVPKIWFLLPEASPVIAPLTQLTAYAKAAPHQANWLRIATLATEGAGLKQQGADAYYTQAMLFNLEHEEVELRWNGRDIETAEEVSLEYFAALQRG